jgi:hypothetical protein
MPTTDFTDEELAALTALLRRAVEEDRFPPRPAPHNSAENARLVSVLTARSS